MAKRRYDLNPLQRKQYEGLVQEFYEMLWEMYGEKKCKKSAALATLREQFSRIESGEVDENFGHHRVYAVLNRGGYLGHLGRRECTRAFSAAWQAWQEALWIKKELCRLPHHRVHRLWLHATATLK